MGVVPQQGANFSFCLPLGIHVCKLHVNTIAREPIILIYLYCIFWPLY